MNCVSMKNFKWFVYENLNKLWNFNQNCFICIKKLRNFLLRCWCTMYVISCLLTPLARDFLQLLVRWHFPQISNK